MKNYLDKLNAAQFEAAITLHGPLLIHAGAGTGKTGTLVARTAYMIDNGISPENILLLTFTNKAAKEMRNRIVDMIGDAANDITAYTFHSFCANILRRYSGALNIKNDFAIIDGSDAKDLLNTIKKEFLDTEKAKGNRYSLKEFPASTKIFGVYTWMMNACMPIEDVIAQKGLKKYEYEVVTIINNYKEHKRKKNIMDYDDLLFYTEYLLRKRDEIRQALSKKYKYISCDEYQDTNIIQDRILDQLAKDNNNLCVVGDCNQSIYSFRCANIDNILTFKNRHPKCRLIVLDKNYRSSQPILDLSNKMMSYYTEDIECNLHSDIAGAKPILYVAESKNDEFQYIIDNIQYALANGIALENMAVMVRSARQSYTLELQLSKLGINYKKYGGLKFFEKAAIKDILAFLRVLINNKDEIALYRLLALYPGIGSGYARKIAEAVAENGVDILETLYKGRKMQAELLNLKSTMDYLSTLSFHEQIYYLTSDYYPGLRRRIVDNMKTSDSQKNEAFITIEKDIEEITEFNNITGEYEDAAKFLEDIVLDSTMDEDKKNILNITTIHSAKGLEYDVVFIMDVVEGITPATKVNSSEDPEEARCLYVAITRAKKECHLIAAMNSGYPQYIPSQLSHLLNRDNIIATMETNADCFSLVKLREEKLDFKW